MMGRREREKKKKLKLKLGRELEKKEKRMREIAPLMRASLRRRKVPASSTRRMGIICGLVRRDLEECSTFTTSMLLAWVMAEGGMDNEEEVRAQRTVGEARRDDRDRRREGRWRQARFAAQRARLEDLRERIRRERRAASERAQGRTLFRIGG
jgi:hypothetical protein